MASCTYVLHLAQFVSGNLPFLLMKEDFASIPLQKVITCLMVVNLVMQIFSCLSSELQPP